MATEQKNHSGEYHFCSIAVSGYNSINKKVIVFPNLTWADRPVGQGPRLHVYVPPEPIDDVIVKSQI